MHTENICTKLYFSLVTFRNEIHEIGKRFISHVVNKRKAVGLFKNYQMLVLFNKSSKESIFGKVGKLQ